MSTFSFTISATDVNSLKNTTGQSSFEAVADRGMQRSSAHRILTAKFGDGYEQRVLDGINTKMPMYFVHSYKTIIEDISLSLADCIYGGQRFCAVLKKGNLYATQFHPEKSGIEGMKIINNFLSIEE